MLFRLVVTRFSVNVNNIRSSKSMDEYIRRLVYYHRDNDEYIILYNTR